jgi:hypothetical protein
MEPFDWRLSAIQIKSAGLMEAALEGPSPDCGTYHHGRLCRMNSGDLFHNVEISRFLGRRHELPLRQQENVG